MSIKCTRFLHAKPLKKINLLDKIKSNQSLKRKQSSLTEDVVTISAQDRKILTKANFSQDETSISYEDSIFGKRKPSINIIKSLSRYFSYMFCKKVSIENTVDKMNSYQKLSYITDPKEFCQKAFQQIKKDFGYESIDIPLVFRESKTCDAGWNLANCVIEIYTDISSPLNGLKKADIIENLIHEFRHVRQTEMSYRTSPEKFLNAIEENFPRRVVGNLLELPQETLAKIAKSSGISLEDLKKILMDCGSREKVDFKISSDDRNGIIFDKKNAKKNLDRVFGQLKPFRKGSVKYQRGLNYIEGERSYIPYSIDKDRYKSGTLEKDAFKSGKNWRFIVESTD